MSKYQDAFQLRSALRLKDIDLEHHPSEASKKVSESHGSVGGEVFSSRFDTLVAKRKERESMDLEPDAAAEMAANAVIRYLDYCAIVSQKEREAWLADVLKRVKKKGGFAA